MELFESCAEFCVKFWNTQTVNFYALNLWAIASLVAKNTSIVIQYEYSLSGASTAVPSR